jgi:hypothetical protein
LRFAVAELFKRKEGGYALNPPQLEFEAAVPNAEKSCRNEKGGRICVRNWSKNEATAYSCRIACAVDVRRDGGGWGRGDGARG